MPSRLDIGAVVAASRRRRLYGAVGGGMLGSGLAALAVSGLNLWLGKPMVLVWVALGLGLPLTIAGSLFVSRVES